MEILRGFKKSLRKILNIKNNLNSQKRLFFQDTSIFILYTIRKKNYPRSKLASVGIGEIFD